MLKFIGNFLLRNRYSKAAARARSAFSLEQAVSIGIVYDATNRDSYQNILKFIQYLKEERKKVTALGFINSKDESQFITSKGSEVFFTKKDLNLFSISKKKETDKFLSQEFDILIDLNIEEFLPLKYITALSRAHFKVAGDLEYQRQYCDLTIDISKQRSVEFLIIQVKHYLKQVSKPQKSYAV